MLPLWVSAQRVSEQEIKIEQLFIDAGREKLTGNTDEAIKIYQEILDMDSENAAAAYEIARIYAGREQFDEAIPKAEMARRKDPQNEWYAKLLAALYQSTGRVPEAASLFADIVEQHPDNPDHYYRWAELLTEAGQLELALRAYNQLEARIGVQEQLARQKHRLYLRQDDEQKAAAELQKLTEAYPSNTEYLHLLAQYYRRIEQPAKARSAYERILEIDPNDPRANLNLAAKEENPSDQLQYVEALRPVFEDPTINIDLKISKILPLMQQATQRADTALAWGLLQLTSILEDVHKQEAKGFAASADLMYYAGEPLQAIEKYQQALQRDETVYEVWEQLLRIQYETGSFAGLMETAENALEIFPNRATLYYLYGYAAYAVGDPGEAIGLLRQASFMTGGDPVLRQLILSTQGMSIMANGDTEEALQTFTAAREIREGNPIVLAREAVALLKAELQPDRAAQLVARCLKITKQAPEVLQAAALLAYQQEDHQQAADYYQQLMQGPQQYNPIVLEGYGDTLFQLQQPEQALDLWSRAKARGANSEFLEKKIADKKLYE